MAELRLCSIQNCGKQRWARGWCLMHYRRWANHGDPHFTKNPNLGKLSAFVRETVLPYSGSDCLKWPFKAAVAGYGVLSWDGKQQLVTRIACEHRNGPPPTPIHEAAHTCGNGKDGCCNPHHLVWKTHAENMADTIVHGTSTRGERQAISKLSPDQVLQIRAMAGIWTYPQMAEKFDVSASCIGAVVRRENWDWL